MNAVATTSANAAAVLERVVIEGDLSVLSPAERVLYYRQVCESAGLNPLTRPFAYIKLNGRLVLYAQKDATDQLRKLNGISIEILKREMVGDAVYMVIARATDRTGRMDEAVGAVNIKGLTAEPLANAIMKAETKAKRRVTLSVSGLGWTDESETDSIQGAHKVNINPETGTEDSLPEAVLPVCELAARAFPQKSPEQVVSWLEQTARKSWNKSLREIGPAEIEQIAAFLESKLTPQGLSAATRELLVDAGIRLWQTTPEKAEKRLLRVAQTEYKDLTGLDAMTEAQAQELLKAIESAITHRAQ